MTGAIVAISSPPIAPPSPACGLRPATAMRGAARPKSATRPAWVTRIVCSRSAGVSAAGTSARGMWIVTGTTRRPGAASIITGSGAPRKVGEKLGVAGEGEAGAVLERLLVDRVGAERRRPALADERNPALDDRNDRGGVGRVGDARRRRPRERMMEDGKAARQRPGGGLGPVDRNDRDRQSCGERGHVRAVADQEEGNAPGESVPGLERDLAADPGRIAEGQRDGKAHRSSIRASPSNSWRKPCPKLWMRSLKSCWRSSSRAAGMSASGIGGSFSRVIDTSLTRARPPEIGIGRVDLAGAEQQDLGAEGRGKAVGRHRLEEAAPLGGGAAAVLAREGREVRTAHELAVEPVGERRRSRPRRARRRAGRSRRG